MRCSSCDSIKTVCSRCRKNADNEVILVRGVIAVCMDCVFKDGVVWADDIDDYMDEQSRKVRQSASIEG